MSTPIPEHPPAVLCPKCGWRTRVYHTVDAIPGFWSCVVCNLQSENELLRRSRNELNAALLELKGL